MVREPLQALYCALGVREGYMCVYSGKRSQGRVTPNPPIHKHIHTRHKNVPLTPFPPSGAKEGDASLAVWNVLRTTFSIGAIYSPG